VDEDERERGSFDVDVWCGRLISGWWSCGKCYEEIKGGRTSVWDRCFEVEVDVVLCV
jgi:hypothetical protein